MTDSTGKILVLVMPEDKYNEDLLEITKELAGAQKSICYVSLNKPYKALINQFSEAGIDSSKFHFIDAITKTAMNPEPSDNCTYISSPGALTELSLSISNYLANNKVETLIFDSLSTLFVHESGTTIIKFIHFLMAKLKVLTCDSYFTILKTDESNDVLKDVHMFADKIIDVSKFKGGGFGIE